MNVNKALKLRKQYIEQQFSTLNDRQLEAALRTEGPLLILAGAGSGKTTVIVNRISNLLRFGSAYESDYLSDALTDEDWARVESAGAAKTSVAPEVEKKLRAGGVTPYSILAITFTNKAADEMKTRIIASAGAQGADVLASTFHSACARFLRRDIGHLGKPQNFTIYDPDDCARALKEIYKLNNINDKLYPIKQVLGRISRLKDEMVSPEEYAEKAYDYPTKEFAKIYALYAQRLRECCALDFDDLIYDMVCLLRDFPEVRENYHRRFRYILVDEYQDTSFAQYKLVELLANERKNVCVVGDDDQSIYRFRGATIENILNFEKHFEGARVIRLEQNYRSTSNILDCANGIISNNVSRKGKTLWTAQKDGAPISFFEAVDEKQEAAFIASTISTEVARGARLSDYAVLYRMNAQSNAIETHFARAGVPYKIVGGLRFYDRAEVKDILAYMCVISNPLDDIRLGRIINKPARKIGDTTLAELVRLSKEQGVPVLEIVRNADAFASLDRARGALERFLKLYDELVELRDSLPLDEFVRQIIERTGYADMLRGEGEEGLTRAQNVNELVSSVKNYCDSSLAPTLEEFLEQVALISSIDTLDGDADRVTLMTLHSAKGLEFGTVFISGLEEGVFPSELSKTSLEDIEEERRLMYVGVTRAKKTLCLSACESRMLFGMTRRNRQSRFLGEIDEKLLDCVGFSKVKPIYSSTFDYKKTPENTIAQSVPKQDTSKYAVGDRVRHKVFGDGTVLSTREVGIDVLLEIDFDAKGIKKTMQNYAPLTKI